MIDPLLRHAPALVRRAPGWALVVALATAALALATATPPLVGDAAADRAFVAEVRASEGAPPGRSLDGRAATRGIVDPSAIRVVSDELDDVPQFAPAIASVSPLAPYTDSTGPLPVIRSASGAQEPAVVYARDGVVESLGGTDGSSGVWVPDTVAEALGLRAGDRAEVTLARRVIDDAPLIPPVAVTIAGVYPTRDGLPVSDRIDWSAIPGGVPDHPLARGRPAPLLLTDPATAVSLIAAMKDQSLVIWDVPWEASVDIQHGRLAADGIAAAVADLHGSDSPIQAAIRLAGGGDLGLNSGVSSFVSRSEQAADELQPLVSSIAVTGRVMSGLVLVLATVLLTRSRRREHQLSVSMGIHPVRLALVTGIELLVPVLVGLGAAYAVVRWQPAWVAGHGAIDRRTLHAATSTVLRSVGVAFASIVIAAFVEAWPLEPSSTGRARRAAGAVHGGTVVVVAAVATGAQLMSQRARTLDSGSSLLFPLFAELAGAVVLVRLLTSMIGTVARRRAGARSRRRPRSLAVWLARRRAASWSGELGGLVIVVAAGVGLFVYSSSVATNGERGVSDKAAALGGATATVPIISTETLPIGADGFPTGLPAATSVVWLTTNVHPGPDLSSDVLLVDPATFGAAVDWRESFAATPLPDLLDAIDDKPNSPEIDVVLAGNYNDDFPSFGTFSIDETVVPYRVVARIAAAPWIRERSSMMLMSARRLASALPVDPKIDPPLSPAQLLDDAFPTFVWADAPAADVVASLGPAVLAPVQLEDDALDVAAAERTPAFVAFGMSLPYLRVVGIGLLAVALASIMVLGARRRADLALEIAMTDRMGIRPSTVGLAVAGGAVLLGLAGAAVGIAVAWPLQRFMISRLDPGPSFAPGFTGGLSSSAIAAAAVAVVAVSLVGALIEVRGARNARVAEVLRGAE